MSYVYLESESDGYGNHLYTVGFYDPSGKWHPESDHTSAEQAANRVAFLNGAAAVSAVLDEALNSGDGVYRP